MKFYPCVIDLPEADRIRLFGERPRPHSQPHDCRALAMGSAFPPKDSYREAADVAAGFNRGVLSGKFDEFWCVVVTAYAWPLDGELIEFPALPSISLTAAAGSLA